MLKLNLDQLHVSSFETAEQADDFQRLPDPNTLGRDCTYEPVCPRSIDSCAY